MNFLEFLRKRYPHLSNKDIMILLDRISISDKESLLNQYQKDIDSRIGVK